MPPRRRPAALGLKIDTPASGLALNAQHGPESTLSESEPPSASAEPLSALPKQRNRKGLSLGLPSAQSSTSSLAPSIAPSVAPSITSQRSLAAVAFRKEEDGSPTVPYADGPIQILPGVWLGSEDNARDFTGLKHRGISGILNVAKEVKPPGNIPPNIDYLQLTWSHGQQHLVDDGFPAAFAFVDASLNRKSGVLVHCQCGISRSSTVIIALVMRWAAEQSPHVPTQVWALKGMSGAYDYVKEKSKWIGPNMSLIYQLLEYERRLNPDPPSPSQSLQDEEEWGRRRKLLDEAPSPLPDEEENQLVMQEARALDKAMEDRIIARKSSRSSVSSIASSTGSGVGMGSAWRSKYGNRQRTSSIASSTISEDLMEEDEDALITGFTDSDRSATNSSPSPGPRADFVLQPPPSAPAFKKSFGLPRAPLTTTRESFGFSKPPPTATRSSFDIPPLPYSASTPRAKRRPMALNVLPPLPGSPVQAAAQPKQDSLSESSEDESSSQRSVNVKPFIRNRTESKKPAPPPLHLRHSMVKQANRSHKRSISAASNMSAASIASSAASAASSTGASQVLQTPSQTLFVFPPSPDAASGMPNRTPSAMTLTSNGVPFPTSATPRVSTFRAQGRTKSFIGLGAPPTPTTAFSKVDAHGFVLGGK